ncbi:MAG: hypothetical protein VKJ04_07635 [Vampirovibrionales bacterium]|nr:hypothetical protein [Vampirovibrionales bacterium]
MTWLSAAQLMTVSLLSWMVFKRYRKTFDFHNAEDFKKIKRLWKAEYIWLLMSWGFLYLAVDELLMIHEIIDKAIHFIFQIQETAITDRLDDVIVLFYALLGLSALWMSRHEMVKYVAAAPLLCCAVIATFTMIGFDLLTSDSSEVFVFLENQRAFEAQLYQWIQQVAPQDYLVHFELSKVPKFLYNLMILFEEGAKVMAGGFLVSTYFKCYDVVRQQSHFKPQAAVPRSDRSGMPA